VGYISDVFAPVVFHFDSAAHNFVFGETESGDRICHGVGIANMPGQEGQTFSHAWIEFTKDGARMASNTIWGVVILKHFGTPLSKFLH